MNDVAASSVSPFSSDEHAVSCDAYRRRPVFKELVPGIVGFCDVFTIIIASGFAHGSRFGWAPAAGESMYLSATAIIAILVAFIFRSSGLYVFETIVDWPYRTTRIAVHLAAVGFVLTGLAFIFKISDQFSRVWLTVTIGGSTGLIWGIRGVAAKLVGCAIRRGVLQSTTAIVGASSQAERFLFENAGLRLMQVAGVFDDRRTRIGGEVAGVPVLGTVSDLITAIRRREIDQVVITLPWNAEERITNLISLIRDLPVSVYLATDLIGYHFAAPQRTLAGCVSALEVARAPLSGWGGVIKAVEDKSLAALALLLLALPMAFIALAIKIESPGPALFRQKRFGFNNELIEVLKFRTMYHHRPDGGAFVQATRDDHRVTGIGRILRRTSLDELPQLINVIRGTMSLVGPRPHPVELNVSYARRLVGYHIRHKVKPGMTGWAQINGWRGETDTVEKMRARVECDIFYIENWSLWLDIRILFSTLFLGWMHKNAY